MLLLLQLRTASTAVKPCAHQSGAHAASSKHKEAEEKEQLQEEASVQEPQYDESQPAKRQKVSEAVPEAVSEAAQTVVQPVLEARRAAAATREALGLPGDAATLI